MSRKSRGFSAGTSATAPPVTCPTTGTTAIDINASNDWTVSFNWSPDVLIGQIVRQYQVNGGGWADDVTFVNKHSGFSDSLDPHGFGDDGDFVEFRGICSDIGGCSDIVCVPAGATVEP